MYLSYMFIYCFLWFCFKLTILTLDVLVLINSVASSSFVCEHKNLYNLTLFHIVLYLSWNANLFKWPANSCWFSHRVTNVRITVCRSVCLLVCWSVCLSARAIRCSFFRGFSLALRSHDQFQASNWSSLSPSFFKYKNLLNKTTMYIIQSTIY